MSYAGKEYARFNLAPPTAEAFAGYDQVDKDDNSPVDNTRFGVEKNLLLTWTGTPTGQNDHDSGVSPDERYDSNVTVSNQSTSRLNIFGLPGGKYQVRIVMGSPVAASVNSAKVTADTTVVTYWTGQAAGAGAWIDQTQIITLPAGFQMQITIGAGGGGAAGTCYLAWALLTYLGQADTATLPLGQVAALVSAAAAEVAKVPYIGPVYDHVPSFLDMGALEAAVTTISGIGLQDVDTGVWGFPQRGRLVMIEHASERRPLSNGTYELIHRLTIRIQQMEAGGSNDATVAQNEVRALADQVCALLGDDAIGQPLQVAVGSGWLGFVQEGGPRIASVGAISWGGVTWHEAVVALAASEEVTRD